MRLGQLARKYGVSQQEIISQLKEMDPSYDKLGHNTKLNEQALSWLANRLENIEDLNVSSEEDYKLDLQEIHKVTEPSPSPADIPEESTEPTLDISENADESEQTKKEEVAIETDKLLELLESDEDPVDLSKITLIKAPKRELDGLKVVGKIELPEPITRRSEKDQESSVKEGSARKRGKHQRPISEEEKEKRRLKAKRKKEQYEARQEKRRKAKEKQRRKAVNRARYQEKLQKTKVNYPKTRSPEPEVPSNPELSASSVPSPPKTLLGKFWRWLNTP